MYRSKNLKKLLAFQSFRFLVILEANLCILKHFGFWYFGCFFFSNFKKMLLHKPRTQLFVLWTGLDCFITSVEFTISLSPGNIVSVRWQTMSHCLNWCCLATRRRPPSKTETAVHLNFNLRRHWTSLSFRQHHPTILKEIASSQPFIQSSQRFPDLYETICTMLAKPGFQH